VLQEFRDFINRGNVVELAVAFVLGVAFKPIIDAIVDRLLMPVIGMLVGQPNFDTVGTFACQPADAADAAAGIVVGAQVCAGSVGAIVTALVNFLLVAFPRARVVVGLLRRPPSRGPGRGRPPRLDRRDGLARPPSGRTATG
jgi:large conductance mechanosensitive channel protein